MTEKKLQDANDLLEQIKNLKSFIKNIENREVGWIEFNFGNGGNRYSVCDDNDIIECVRELIIKNSQQRLKDLEEKFAYL